MYDSVISQMLATYATRHDWEGMLNYLHQLSNARFRSAGISLANDVLRKLSADDFWQCFLCIVSDNTKAHLMTFLKAAVQNYREFRLTFNHPALLTFARQTSEKALVIDERKTLQTLIPIVRTPEEVQQLIEAFSVDTDHPEGVLDNYQQRITYYLIAAETMPAYYVLFLMLRQGDDHRETLISVCRQLLARHSRLAFNLVSIMKNYFDLSEVPGTFSLRISPFELSRLDSGYQTFCNIMLSI